MSPGRGHANEVTATGTDSQDPAASGELLVASILDCVAQPVWMVDHNGLIRFANPSAVAALGYADASELYGKPSHQTIHYKRPDGSPFPAKECPMLLPRTTGETIHRVDDWFVRRDGSMFPVECWSAPIDAPAGRGAVVAFTDLSERRQAKGVLREHGVILSVRCWARLEAVMAAPDVAEGAGSGMRVLAASASPGAAADSIPSK